MPEKRIKFKGNEYLLIQLLDNVLEGAIATREQYENFEQNEFHLFPDGKIRSYGEVVGTIDDIEFIEDN